MTKREFLRRLRKKLNCDDKDDIIAYYNELIEDKMDKTGLTEEEVIDCLDDIDDIVRKTNVQSGVYQKIKYDEDEISKKKRKSSSGNILTKILYFPMAIVAFTLYLALICLCVSLGLSLGLSGIAMIIFGIINLQTSISQGIIMISLGILSIGLTLIVVPLIYKLVALIITLIKKLYKKIALIITGGVFCEN
jgi:hypothetical protein